MMVSGIRFAAVLTLLFGLLTAAHAQTTDYSFQVHWTTGELAGTSSAGSFSFDSALAVPNALYSQPDLLSSFGFTLRGSFYDLSAVKTAAMVFDPDGQLGQLLVGTHCRPNACEAFFGNTNSFYLFYGVSSGVSATAGDSGRSISFGQQVSPVPEPSTAALWAVGLVLGGLLIRRRDLRLRPMTSPPRIHVMSN